MITPYDDQKMCHIIETSTVRPGDQVYRRLKGISKIFGFHHAIVIEAPEPGAYTNDDDIKVIEMTRHNGVRINSMTGFLDGDHCRLVYYGARESVYNWHKAGTCHLERSSPWKEIKKRVDRVRSHIDKTQDPEAYSVLGANCEEFAVWLKTGIYKGAQTQLSWWSDEFAASAAITGIGAVVGAVKGGCEHAANQVLKEGFSELLEYAVKEATEEAIEVALSSAASEAAREAAEESLKKAVAINAVGVGVAIGVGVVWESAVTAYRIYQYNTDYKYLKCDIHSDVARGWGVTAVCTGVGIACLPLGWWAILPAVGAGLFCDWLFRKIESKWFHKSQKEKLYIEYGLNAKSSKEDLKKVRKEILDLIVDEKLHPDKWSKDLKEKEKAKRLEKYLWMTSLRETLSKDIAREYVSFDEEDNEHFPRMLESSDDTAYV